METSLIKDEAIKNFKKIYKGGYLGYSHIQELGSVYEFINIEDYSIENYIKDLEP